GVSVVRGLGPGLPYHPLVARGRRFRQGTATAVPWPPLPPSQRPDSGLRVELQRRQSPSTPVGGLGRVQLRQTVARKWGHWLPQVLLRQAVAELHLVGEPQGRG